MKRTTISKSIPFLTSLIVSSFAFGLFVLVPQFVQHTSGDVILSEEIRRDTVRNAKTNAESNEAVASGDGYFAKKDYLNAKAAYQLAIDLNPANNVAREKLQKTMELLRSQKAQNVLFDVAVAAADKLFQAKEYEKAKLEYENAGKLLPENPYPKNRINEIIKIQVDLKVREEEYAKAIASGDKSFNTNNLQLALLDYKKASGLKPEEKYPQQRIKEINDRLALQKQKDDAYNKAIQLADQHFKASKYADAKKSYQDALVVNPEQVYPKNRITEIDGLLARILKSQQDYDRYVANGDSLYIEKQYLKARENYLMASSVKPNESYPREMVIKADKMLTGQEAALAKALEEQYSTTIAEADKLFAENQLEPSRAEYVKASNLKPAENYPKEKIRQIDESFSAALRNKDEAYQKAIAAGDKALAARVLEMAKSEYESALKIKPGEPYPRTKLEEIDKLLALENARKAEDAKYTDAIATGDSLFFAKAWQPAKAKFQAALVLKPKEAYPRNRIAEIDAKLAEMEKDKAKEAQYNNLIAKADKGLKDKQYQIAKEDYSKASALKPDESYPREKISEIDFILADLAKAKALDEKYRNLIVQADKQLSVKSYPEARVSYTEASALKPAETYPQTKVAEIDKILADLAARKSADENYQALIKSADELLAANSFPAARDEYVKAGGIKPGEQYPKTKISEIDKILAQMDRQKALEAEYAAAIARGDKLLDEKALNEAKVSFQNAQKAKPTESYPAERIAVIDQLLADQAAQRSLDEKYQAAIKLADDQFLKKSYEASRNSYNNALTLKSGESYPQTRISEIDRILADQAAQKELDDRFRATITKADQFFTSKSYTEAKTEYQAALGIKPEEIHPKNRIAEIDKIEAEIAARKSLEENYQATIARADGLLGTKSYESARLEYVKAQELKPQEKYPQGKIAEIDAAMAEIARKNVLEQEYAGIISEADRLMGEKAFAEAKSQYQASLKLKPGEKYPTERIAEADKALAEVARQKALDNQYQAILVKADNLLAQKSYEQSKTEYQNALSIKPGQKYPAEKISEIDKALADLAAAKALDDRYQAAIVKADQLFMAKTYELSRKEYEAAGQIKPAESYPSGRIAEIDKILADLAAAKKREEDYKNAITLGDNQLAAKSYEAAKGEYSKALLIAPGEAYPTSKIAEIDAILADQAKRKAINEEYTATMNTADQLLAEKSYENAKAKYQRAQELKPGESLPKEKISLIDREMADKARQKALDDQYQAAIAEADKLFQSATYDQARAAYSKAENLKPAETYPVQKIKEIDALIAAQAKQRALDENYRNTVARADQHLNAKSYDLARNEFTNALTLKPEEQYPKTKIAEIDGILEDIRIREEAYKTAITKADQLLAQRKYEEARAEYLNALEVKPQDVYARGKLGEISKAQEELLGKQKYYDNLIADADRFLVEKDYGKAKDHYQRALGVFPDNAYPKERIARVTATIDSIYRVNRSKYDKAVGDGDRFYNNYEYDKAIDAYSEAAGLLPMENYPREMIVKIRKTIAENAIADVLNSTVTITSNDEKQFSFTPIVFASRKNNFVYIKIRNLSGKPFNVLMRYGKDKQSNGGVVMRNISIDGNVNERLVSVRDQDLWSREDNNWISLIPQGGDIEVSFIQVSRARQD